VSIVRPRTLPIAGRSLRLGKADRKIVPSRLRTLCWKGLSAKSEEKREPASDTDAVVDSLKALDLKRPIREADIQADPRRSYDRRAKAAAT
jgi:hypothetical protein